MLAFSLFLLVFYTSVFLPKLVFDRSGFKLIICSPESSKLSHASNYNW